MKANPDYRDKKDYKKSIQIHYNEIANFFKEEFTGKDVPNECITQLLQNPELNDTPISFLRYKKQFILFLPSPFY